MGVLIEAVNVVVRNATVEARLAGGMQEYERRCPNDTFCTDGEVCRVGFMTTLDATSYIESLVDLGFRRPTPEGSPDVALITQVAGFDHPCDWLELCRIDLGDGQSAEVAWLRGSTLSTLVAPPEWTPGAAPELVTPAQLREQEFLGTTADVDVFRDRTTGELHYVGRTQLGVPPASISAAAVEDRISSLVNELTRLGGFEDAPAGEYRGELAALHRRAKQLVEDTGAGDPGPLHLQGIAARLLGEWEEAASLFRRVTELWPQGLDGWLELTWASASLRRFDEAERAARKAVELAPNGANALGNLAAVLLEQGKFLEARQMAEKAVEADPADSKSKAVLAAAQRAASAKSPWWNRLLRTRRV